MEHDLQVMDLYGTCSFTGNGSRIKTHNTTDDHSWLSLRVLYEYWPAEQGWPQWLMNTGLIKPPLLLTMRNMGMNCIKNVHHPNLQALPKLWFRSNLPQTLTYWLPQPPNDHQMLVLINLQPQHPARAKTSFAQRQMWSTTRCGKWRSVQRCVTRWEHNGKHGDMAMQNWGTCWWLRVVNND